MVASVVVVKEEEGEVEAQVSKFRLSQSRQAPPEIWVLLLRAVARPIVISLQVACEA